MAFICKECSKNLKIAYAFQCKCRESEIFLKNANQGLIQIKTNEKNMFYNIIEVDKRSIENSTSEFNVDQQKSSVKEPSKEKPKQNSTKRGKLFIQF